MSGGKVSVRQKMINMMYLVLTALLALNVSAEILKAFHLVEVSMEKAGANIDKKNTSTIEGIEKYVKNNPKDPKGVDAQNKALQVDKIAKDALKYLSDLKIILVDGAGGRKEGEDGKPNPNEEITEASNIEKHANLMIVQGKGAEMKAKINEWRTKMLALVPEKYKNEVRSDLVAVDPKDSKQTWESEMFEHSPVAAVVTLLTKTENDVKNTESQVLDQLNKDLLISDYVVTGFVPKVIPNNGTYITAGGKYSSDIFLAAESGRMAFDLTVNGSPVKVEGGVGKYEVIASGEGEKKYTANITQRKTDGNLETYKVEGSYFVVKPLAVVSATKMNVVYRGLENPISVSVPGYSASQTQVTSSLGSLKPSTQAGTFNLSIPVNDANRELTISVSVKAPEGVKKMGEQKYRIKNIPKPTPMLGAIEASGAVTSAQLRSAAFVFTALKDFAFEGVNYTPLSYTIVYAPKKGDARPFQGNGASIPSDARAAFNGARPGDRVILTNIKAMGPAGAVIVPTSLAIEVKP
jgi:gliding motility-associated protein GldM